MIPFFFFFLERIFVQFEKSFSKYTHRIVSVRRWKIREAQWALCREYSTNMWVIRFAIEILKFIYRAIFVKSSFPSKKKTEKPWLNPKPKDELACQIEDKEGHDGYRHQEVELYFHYLIVCNLKLKIGKQFLLIFLFFRIESYDILIQQRNSWLGKCLSILRGGRWRPKDTYLSRALHIYEILCIYIYMYKGSIYWIGKMEVWIGTLHLSNDLLLIN